MRRFLPVFALAVIFIGNNSIPAAPPNIVFLLSDDQRPDTIRALGNTLIDTPNLDALVREGTTFTRAVSPNPVCVPSRAEILTGCSGFRNGILPGFTDKLDPRLKLWPETLKDAGYQTCYVGKWHTQGRPSQRGYVETQGLYSGGAKNPPKQLDFKGRAVTGYGNWVFQTDDGKQFPEQGIGLTPDISSKLADHAIGFIKRKHDKPFFLHVNFTAPHDPLLLPPGDAKKYDPKKMPLPPNFLPKHPFDHGNFMGRDEKLLPWPRTEDDIREELAAYYAIITDLDQQIGRIIKALKDAGQGDNTIIVFSADHGLAIGSHGLRGKQNMYEHTVGVPLIMSGPGIPKGAKSDAQIYLRDLFPTTCDLAGVKVPDGLDGKSIAPVLKGKAKSIHDEVYGHFTDSQRMIRTDRWKLVHYPKIKKHQLFDIVNDPSELKDLSEDEKYAKVRMELDTKLQAWQKKVGDPLVAP